jgi:hypothetical protein
MQIFPDFYLCLMKILPYIENISTGILLGAWVTVTEFCYKQEKIRIFASSQLDSFLSSLADDKFFYYFDRLLEV